MHVPSMADFGGSITVLMIIVLRLKSMHPGDLWWRSLAFWASWDCFCHRNSRRFNLILTSKYKDKFKNVLLQNTDHPRYLEANTGCKHFDVHGGPENVPVSRFSFDAKVWKILLRQSCPLNVSFNNLFSIFCSFPSAIGGWPSCLSSRHVLKLDRGV